MKKKKNIIKKIELNKVFRIPLKKTVKHFFREVRFKNKFYRKVLNHYKSFFKINKLSKKFRYDNLNIYKNFIINKYSYFNCISNGLDLKYNNLFQDLSNIEFINFFDKRKCILLNKSDYDIIKYQKFITYVDNIYVYTDINDFNTDDVINLTYNSFFSYIQCNYIFCYLLILII